MPMKQTNSEGIAPWIQTYSGRKFDFSDMSKNVFDPEEVATVLSRVPRFAAHSRWPYTVAQHSVLVARNCWNELRLAALLHDAAECFIGDTSAPVKYYLKSNGDHALANLERKIETWVADQNRFSPRRFEEVKHEDLRALATEARDIMLEPPASWIELPDPWPERIEPWEASYARDEWLRLYYAC